ncbi:MAG: hypothetical protein ACRC33_10415, partial [Gemmataceae bacterium]
MFRIVNRFRRTVASAALAAVGLTGCVPPGALHTFLHQEECLNAKVCAKPTVHVLAKDIDLLEAHIEKYGSVVAKQPDVWGEARLTKHREEFEKYMGAQIDNFKPSLQGTVSASDQAYFANAFALSAAVGGQQAGLFAPRPRVVVNTATTAGTKVDPGTVQKAPDLPDLTDEFGALAAGNLSRSQVNLGTGLGFKGATADPTNASLTLEPTVLLDQRARYIQHLHQLRRINEGDDTADSPGYALNLVRIPVSLLPGKKTDVGHGAEVTMTVNPHLTEALLPQTFRNLVQNDLTDQIGVPLTQMLNDRDVQTDYEKPLVRYTFNHPPFRTALLSALQGEDAGNTFCARYQAAKNDVGWEGMPKDIEDAFTDHCNKIDAAARMEEAGRKDNDEAAIKAAMAMKA